MSRFRGDLPQRSEEFALEVISLVESLPRRTSGWVLGKQLMRSGTSIGANIAEANEALTDREFVQRCSIARKEAAETHYWLRLATRSDLLTAAQTDHAVAEVTELLAILTTIILKSQQRSQ